MKRKIPRSLNDIYNLITMGVMEDVHLDYKDSRALDAKSGEIAKDVSAFANSDGGIIIYGVVEEKHFPISIDEGVIHEKKSREWLEQIIISNISPPLDGLEIVQIPLNDDRSIYVVAIERSIRAPHQERQSRRYYKRHNFSSSPMEDYEINDLRNRKIVFPPLVNVDVEFDRDAFIELYIENIGDVAATDIKFEFSPKLHWRKKCPTQFERGINILAPRKKLYFFYSTIREAFAEDSKVIKSFTVSARYYHSTAGTYITDIFYIDIGSYEGTSIIRSELYYQSKKIEDTLSKLISEIQKMNNHLQQLESIVAPTGLNLSVTTFRNLANIRGSTPKIEKLNPFYCDHEVFEEVLGVNRETAINLYYFFSHRYDKMKLEDVEGMDANLLSKIEECFDLSEK